MKRTNWIWGALLAMTLGFLSGCSFLQGGLSGDDARAELVLRAAVISGTSRLIDGDAARRDEVLRIAGTISDYLEKNPEGRAADVGVLLKNNIPWDKLTNEEKLLTSSLIIYVQEEVARQIEQGVVPGDILVYLETIVKWVTQTASVVYVADTGGGSGGYLLLVFHEGQRDAAVPMLVLSEGHLADENFNAMFTAGKEVLYQALTAGGQSAALAAMDRRPAI